MNSDRSKEWRELDDLITEKVNCGNACCIDCALKRKELRKSFQSLLDSQRQELVEKVKGLITEYTPYDYNVAIGDIINLIKEYE